MNIETLIIYNDFKKEIVLDWTQNLGEIAEEVLRVCHLMIYQVEHISFQNMENEKECILGSPEASFDQPLDKSFLEEQNYPVLTVLDRTRDESGKVKPDNPYIQAYNQYQQEKADLALARNMQDEFNYQRFNGNEPPSIQQMMNFLARLGGPLEDSNHTPNDDDSSEDEFVPPSLTVNLTLGQMIEFLNHVRTNLNPPPLPPTPPLPDNEENSDEGPPPLEDLDEGPPPLEDLDEGDGVPFPGHPGEHIQVVNSMNHLTNLVTTYLQSLPMPAPMDEMEDVKVTLTPRELQRQHRKQYQAYCQTKAYQEGQYKSQTCNICLEDFQPTDMLLIIRKCSHYFHNACIEKWLKEDSNKCPVCRVEVAKGRPNLTH